MKDARTSASACDEHVLTGEVKERWCGDGVHGGRIAVSCLQRRRGPKVGKQMVARRDIFMVVEDEREGS